MIGVAAAEVFVRPGCCAVMRFCNVFDFKQNLSATLGLQPYLKLTLTLELIIHCLLSEVCARVLVCVCSSTSGANVNTTALFPLHTWRSLAAIYFCETSLLMLL